MVPGDLIVAWNLGQPYKIGLILNPIDSGHGDCSVLWSDDGDITSLHSWLNVRRIRCMYTDGRC